MMTIACTVKTCKVAATLQHIVLPSTPPAWQGFTYAVDQLILPDIVGRLSGVQFFEQKHSNRDQLGVFGPFKNGLDGLQVILALLGFLRKV